MRWSGRKSRGPIGIDVGSRFIKAVQVSRGGKQPRVDAAVVMPRLKEGGVLDHDEVARLSEVLYRQGFEGREVVLSAPAETLMSGTLTLPPKQSGAPVDQIARMELARQHKQDPASFELAFWELPAAPGRGGSTGGASVMAVACPHTEAETLLDLFESVDLDVMGIDVHWLSLARACAPMLSTTQPAKPEDGGAVTAIIDIGWRAARVFVLRDGAVLFERLLNEGGLCRLRDTIKTMLSVDDTSVDYLLRDVGCRAPEVETNDRRSDPTRQERGDRREGGEDDFKEPRRLIGAHFDAIKDELQVSLSYAVQQFRGNGVASLLLTGGGGGIPGLAEHLTKACNITAAPADIGQLAQCPAGITKFCGSTVLTAALGLGMYEV